MLTNAAEACEPPVLAGMSDDLNAPIFSFRVSLTRCRQRSSVDTDSDDRYQRQRRATLR
jgi:hypothetical protein